jgi:3-oxoacyl-[acyl-carrier protein] reductase
MMPDKKMLDQKNIIVTGSRRGMGRQMITTFAENGANLFAHARTPDPEHEEYCRELASRCHVNIIPIYFDMSNEAEIKEGIRKIRSEKVDIDGLVNNAGITYTALVQMTSIDKLRELMDVNFVAPYILCQYISKLMVKNKKGSIVNISSSAALDGNPGMAAYGASKAALICMTKALAAELGDDNIRVNAICPGMTETDMIDNVKSEIFEIQKKASFLKKLAKPIDIANAAMMLLSDYSEYVTGQVISVDGGITQYQKR